DGDLDRGGASEQLDRDQPDDEPRQHEQAKNLDPERPGQAGVAARLYGGVHRDKTAPSAARLKIAPRYASEKWKRREAQRSPSAVRPRQAIQSMTAPRMAAPIKYTGPNQRAGTRLTSKSTIVYATIDRRVPIPVET